MERGPAKIIVAGSYATALVMRCQRLPTVGETVLGSGFRTTHGGKGSNMAVQAARLGASCAFAGVVGRDSFADAFLHLLRSEGIDAAAVRQTGEAATGVGFILFDESGRNLIAVDMGANRLFGPADVDAAAPLFEWADVVMMPLEIPLETALHAVRLGRSRGLITILNPAPAQDLSGQDLNCVDYLTPNETEARVCAGLAQNDPASLETIAGRLLDRGCRHVVITLGEQGCACFDSHRRCMRVPAFAVAAVDTTGAGDAFNAGLAVGLAEGRPLEQALRLANAAAGLSVTRPDTVPSYHRRPEIERLQMET